MQLRSRRWILFTFLHIVHSLTVSRCYCADNSAPESPTPVPSANIVECLGGGPSYVRAQQEFQNGVRLAQAGDARSVDWFFVSAQTAWQDLSDGLAQDPPRFWQGSAHLYNSAVTSLVIHGHRLGRLDPQTGLHVILGGTSETIPIVAVDLHWRLDQVDCLRSPAVTFENPCFAQFVRHGVGAAVVGVHYRRPDIPGERQYMQEHPFPITAVLRVQPQTGATQIEFHNPVTHRSVDVAGRELMLSSNIAGALQFALERLLSDVDPLTAFINPNAAVNYEGLLLLQPYQPGKIPVVLVHGLLSNPATWGPLINVLLNNPELMERFQIWGYLYPTGVSLLKTAANLRQDLRDTLVFLDPSGRDPALQEMVLIGHSMGGLLSRLQVTWSGNLLWDTFANVPFGQVQGDAATKQNLADLFFFGPQPFVTRVVFMAVPHQGSEWNACVLGCLGRVFAGRPPSLVELWSSFSRLNPGVFRSPFNQGLPSSLDALAMNSPIVLAVAKLPFSSRVRLHSIIGTGGCEPCCSGDGLVSIESARLLGVESELFVDAAHNEVKEHPNSIREVQRILWVHWNQFTARNAQRAPTPPEVFPVPSPAE